MKKIAIILILLLTMGSCIKQSLLGHNAQVFKFKEGHYRPDNTYVILTRDKTGISAITIITIVVLTGLTPSTSTSLSGTARWKRSSRG